MRNSAWGVKLSSPRVAENVFILPFCRICILAGGRHSRLNVFFLWNFEYISLLFGESFRIVSLFLVLDFMGVFCCHSLF